METVTVPFPVPVEGDVSAAGSLLLNSTFHRQPEGAVTVMVAVPPAEVTEGDDGWYVQLEGGCTIL